MPTTTRLALAFLAAVVLALTFYAYPSWSGFLTVAFRAAAIVGILAVAALLIASVLKRRPGRFDLILALAAIALVAASWNQVNARIDAGRLDGEIAEAGPANVMTVLETTETNTGALVRDGNRLRAETNAEIELMIAGLWDEERLVITATPDPIDMAQLEQLADRIGLLQDAEERARGTIDAMIDAEIEAITQIETPLPDSARLVFVDTAIQRVETDRRHYHQRLAVAAERLNAAADLVALLEANLGAFRFDNDAQEIVFDDETVGQQYDGYLTVIDNTWTAEDTLIAEREAGEIEAVLALVEAAGATP